MLSRQITVADLVKVTGYTRHQIHSLVRMALSGRPSKGERFAREFRHQDLIVVAALAELETKYGIGRAHLGTIAKRLSQELAAPRKPSGDARLVISFDPAKVTYSDEPIIPIQPRLP